MGENKRADAAWRPTRQDGKSRRIFRNGKLKRRAREIMIGDGRHDATRDDIGHRKNDVQRPDSRNQQSKLSDVSSSELPGNVWRVVTQNFNGQRKNKYGQRPDSGHQQSKYNATSSIEKMSFEHSSRKESPKQEKLNSKHKKKEEGRDRLRHDVIQSIMKQQNITTLHKMRKDHHNYQRTKILKFRPHPSRRKSKSSPWILSLPTPSESINLNQLVLLDGNDEVSNVKDGVKLKAWLARRDKRDEEDLDWRSQTVVWEKAEDCVPMSRWQTHFHPTCNSLHDMDIALLLHDSAFSLVSSKGHWRNAWKVNMAKAEANRSVRAYSSNTPRTKTSKESNDEIDVSKYVVLKSLKYIHEPNEEVFELSRVDAVSLDVLTQSRFTINIHGFCGTSSIQEFAGGDLKGLLPTLNPIDKLRMATWVAEGVADIHAVNNNTVVNNDNVGNRRSADAVPLVHNDINMDNVLLGNRQGIEVPIINDFNIAVFRKKHAQTGEPCQFRGRFANPQWMSPEQQERPKDELSTGYLNEKIDIYALGNILFKIAVGNSPWKYEYKVKRITPEMKAKIARAKLRGAKPKVPIEIRNTTDPSIKAVLIAMERSYRNDADLRPSARELADYLKSELDAVELPINVVDQIDLN